VTLRQRAENLRVTAYVVVRSADEAETLDPSHFSQLTDMILMGAASFDTEGRVNLCGGFCRLQPLAAVLQTEVAEMTKGMYCNSVRKMVYSDHKERQTRSGGCVYDDQ
jgi:hypothetical protein